MTRCKFRLQSKRVQDGPNPTAELTFWAVTSGSKENEEFFRYTPSGQLTLCVVRPEVAEQLTVGAEYYLDISPAG